MSAAGTRLSRAAAGAALALGTEAVLRARPPGAAGRWARTNHRGRPVTLLSGPALAVAATCTAGSRVIGRDLSACVAGLGAAALGAYDDAVGGRDGQLADKGLRGHAAAMREGRLSAGAVKVVGIGLTGVVSAALLPGRRRPLDVLLGGALVAGSANLLNLLDLRPGRALKAGMLAAVALGQPGPAGAAAALLPADLREHSMLGDAGANGLGAVLGLALVRRRPQRQTRAAALGVVVALTAASEVVSYSRVIDAVGPLRWVDRLGRLP